VSDCTQLIEGASAGVAPSLRAVDCVAAETTAAAFNRLFGVDGAMAPVLTILLTLYIAFFAVSLLTGRSRLSVSALTPRMLTFGLVLTFATSWVAYQSVFWNLAVGGPDWIASVLTGAKGSATQIFADRIDIVFAAIGQVSEAAKGAAGAGGSGGGSGQAAGGAAGMFSPADVMWLGALLLLLGTVGVLLTARIALAVLLALGPVFVILALFGPTKGLTAGWVRGVALTALTPLFVVLAGGITLELLVPVLSAMTQSVEPISGRSAMALFVLAAVHVALMVMVLKVAGTMVSGWQVFGLASGDTAQASNTTVYGDAGAAHAAAPIAPLSPAQAAGARRAPVVATNPSAGEPAVAGQQAQAGRSGDRRTVITQVSGGGLEPVAARSQNRARGIGSRYRSASNDSAARPARMELKR